MVKKRIINNINECIPSANTYKNIETKLDFNGFQTGNIPKTKKPLKFIIPISAICTALVVAAIVVPVTLSKQNEQTILNPISNEIMSFYLKNTSFNGSGDIPQGTSVGGLYNTYKQRPEKMAELASNKEIFNLTAENKIHCYYVTKEVLDAVNQQLVPPNDSMLPWRGLTAYGYGYYGLSEDLKAQELMEAEIDTDVEKIQTKIDNYYLLDAVRFYTDSSIDDYYWIDFVNYDIKEDLAIFNISDVKNAYKYCTCTFINPNKLSEKDRIYNYSYLCILDFHGFEIETEGNREIAKDTFAFDSRHTDVDNDVNYYDDINACIISKELLSSTNNYGYLYEIYNVIFDFDKLVKMFGFTE